MTRLPPYALTALALASAGPSQAETPAPGPQRGHQPGEVIEVIGDRPAGLAGPDGLDPEHADAARALAEPAFVTIVRADDRVGETVSVAEVLAESAGIAVRRLGGLGGFASIAVRGAAPGHTAIALDGVPVSSIAYAGKDLGLFDLGAASELELYRGGVPVERGGAALGGALNFVTGVGRDRDDRRFHLSAGLGSFGARHLRARVGDDALAGALGYSGSLGYRAADGDYEYFNDNGTPLNREDDAFVARANNGFEQVDAAGRAAWSWASGTVTAGARSAWKLQGVPGRASVQTTEASLDTDSHLADLSAQLALGQVTLRGGGFTMIERQRFTDLLGEVGVGSEDNAFRTFAAGGRGSVSAGLGPRQRVTAGLDGRLETFVERDRLSDASGASGRRLSAGLAVSDELTAWGDRLVAVPALRLDLMRTDPGGGWDPLIVDPGALGARADVYASPRLAARARMAERLAVKASAGRYFRAPTLVELFGDRGYLVGDPSLSPETGVSADLGLSYASGPPRGALDRVYAELAAFGSRPHDAIAFVPSAGRVAVAKNLGDADIWGAEAELSVRLWRAVTATASYTYLASRQRSATPAFDAKRLPGRPLHQAFARVDAARRVLGRLVVAWADVDLSSGNFLDAANLNQVPARRLVGCGLKLEPVAGLVVAAEVKNLFHARVEDVALDPAPRPDLARVPRAIADYLGYPLPGRALYLSMDWMF
jgi:iron complex outermembrane receptor protein